MKILHIGKYFTPFKGDIENVMLALMKAQNNFGNTLGALVHHHQTGNRFHIANIAGGRIYRLPIQVIVLFVPICLSAWCYLKAILKREQPDIIHCHMPNVTCFWLLFLPIARRIPWVVHWHSDVVGEKPHWSIKLLYPKYRLCERALLARAKAIIVTSQHYLASRKPLVPLLHKCNVVPLGLEDTVETTTTDRTGPVTLLCIGRLTYYKRHRYLVEAMQQLNTENVKLIIVGAGDEAETLSSQVKQYGVASSITFKSGVSDTDLLAMIKECDALVLPSIERTEAFGLVLLEAMRAGNPCICTDVAGSGMSEVVVHNETGLVAKHANTSSLASCIEVLADDPSTIYKAYSRVRALNR